MPTHCSPNSGISGHHHIAESIEGLNQVIHLARRAHDMMASLHGSGATNLD